MIVNQHTHYEITEWDDSKATVKVRTVGGKVVGRNPVTEEARFCKGGEVLMQYEDGVTHRVSARYFQSLSPQQILVIPVRYLFD
jgi:hypothetical protein